MATPARVNFVQAGQNGTTGTTFASPAQSVTAGNALVACIGGNATVGQTVTGVTDTAGNTWVKLTHVFHTADKFRQEVWCVANAKVHAANIVTATWSATIDFRGIVVMQYSGLDPVTPLDDTEVDFDAPFVTPALTGTTAESVHILMSRWGFGSTVFPAGFTEFTTAGPGVPEVADKVVTGGPFTGTYTLTSCNFFALAVILKTPSAAAPTGPRDYNTVLWMFLCGVYGVTSGDLTTLIQRYLAGLPGDLDATAKWKLMEKNAGLG